VSITVKIFIYNLYLPVLAAMVYSLRVSVIAGTLSTLFFLSFVFHFVISLNLFVGFIEG